MSTDLSTPHEAEKRALNEDHTGTKRAKLDAPEVEPVALNSPNENGSSGAAEALPVDANSNLSDAELADSVAADLFDEPEPKDEPEPESELNGESRESGDAVPEQAAPEPGAPAVELGEPADHAELAELKGESPAPPTTTETAPEPTEPEDAMTPLERAHRAAEAAKVELPEGLDPENPTALPKHQHKYVTNALRAIKRLKDAAPFLAPVDPEKQGVPQYFEFIKTPMDLGTMEKKLTDGDYISVRQLADDFDLVVSNCIIFNGEAAVISKMALSVAQSFNKHFANTPAYDELDPKAKRASVASSTRQSLSVEPQKHIVAPGVPMLRRDTATDGRPKREIHPPKPRDLPYGESRPRNKKFAAELKFAGQVVKELTSRKHENVSWPFLQPVDPVAQGIPNYLDIVKEPMDLSTIQHKLSEGQYYNADEFEADIRLMFRNCYAFNPEGQPVNDLGHRLEAIFDKRWIEKPLPASTPPPMMSSDESDYNDEYEELGLSNPAIEVLVTQLRMIKQEVRRLKREAVAEYHGRRNKKKGGSRAAGSVSTTRRPSHSTARRSKEPSHEVTYEMMKELSERINTLDEDKLRRVVEIIQETMPHLKNSGQEEIELDMTKLDQGTLRKLCELVDIRPEVEKSSTPMGTSPGPQQNNKKKKSKPLTEDEQNRQIEEIQEKLRQFEQYEGGAPSQAPSQAAPADSDDSSSEDEGPGDPMALDSESSSEEE